MNSFTSAHTLGALPFSPRAGDLYSQVFDAILERRIHATSRFTEDSLAQMFGARRSEVRDVLNRLSHQQIIMLCTHHRPRVAVLDIEQTRQALHARRLVEITVLQLACKQPCPRAIGQLRKLIDDERKCIAQGEAIRLAGAFHLQLAEMGGNAPLAHFLGDVVPLISLAIAQFDLPVEDYCDWQVHQGILDLVERGESVKAVELLSSHLDYLDETLLNSGPGLSRNRVAG